MESRAGYLPGFITGLLVGTAAFLVIVKLAAAW
jgi:hypothetical protein